MIAAAVVHTSGINWESVLTIAAAVVVAVFTAATYLGRRMEKNRDKQETFVAGQVSAVTAALSESLHIVAARVDTAVARIDKVDTHLNDQDKSAITMIERVSRIEGRLNGPVWSAAPPQLGPPRSEHRRRPDPEG